MTPTWNKHGEFFIKFINSSPVGVDQNEYVSCYTTRRKRASEGCLEAVDKTQEEHDVEKTVRYSVSKIINTAMHIQMAKGMVGSALDADFRRILKEASILSEEASIELGPEVMIAEAVIFAVVDGYYSSKVVQKIEEQISLSWGEDVVQWLRSFLTAHESDYIRKLIQEKALLQMSIQDMTSKFALHNYSYEFYATPSFYVDNDRHARQVANNFIDVNQRIDIESRTWPQANQRLHVECAYPDEYKKIVQ
uniref:Uncharacterized protein n=1 Tax=Romanomermis culicivorax TaxID=13658 RepID=A0A915IWH0_ROMCU